jgi:L-lysine 2,3-aminomutase
MSHANRNKSWKNMLAQAITDPSLLFEHIGLNNSRLTDFDKSSFRLKVPLGYANRINKNDLNDPLLRQILPTDCENVHTEGFTMDPVGELDSIPASNIIHKYQGRVLLMVGKTCAVHCRFCFRKHFPYIDNLQDNGNWNEGIKYIQERPELSEVILSGGDPLALGNHKLGMLLDSLHEIDHIQRIRIHSRFLTMIPERLDSDLQVIFKKYSKKLIFVTHTNHPNEIDESVNKVLLALREQTMMLLNHSVLLKGVNDSPNVLCELSEKLFLSGVTPYYLHYLDKVHGSSRFYVNEITAQELILTLRKQLPGYLVPRLVRENSGDLAKEYMPIECRVR